MTAEETRIMTAEEYATKEGIELAPSTPAYEAMLAVVQEKSWPRLYIGDFYKFDRATVAGFFYKTVEGENK